MEYHNDEKLELFADFRVDMIVIIYRDYAVIRASGKEWQPPMCMRSDQRFAAGE